MQQSYTIEQWCHKRQVCRATFYNLLKTGKAPRILRIGSRIRISPEADAEWQEAREVEAAATPSVSTAEIARRAK